MKNIRLIFLAALLLLLFLLSACATQEVTVGLVAWKFDSNGEVLVKPAGQRVDGDEYRISRILELAPNQVAIGKDNVILGPGGSYPDQPNPTPEQGLVSPWQIKEAFCTDGTVAGIIGKQAESSANEMTYEVMTQPRCYPYPKDMVRQFVVGPVQIRTQTTETYSSGQTGLEVCNADPANNVCDGSITGIILSSNDPNIKGIIDFDFIGYWDLTNPGGLWQVGDPKEFLIKMVVNQVRGMRGSLANEHTPSEFANSQDVEVQITSVTLTKINEGLDGTPFSLAEVRIRGRSYNETEIQIGEAEHQANMQALANEQLEIEAELLRDQTEITAATTLRLQQIEADSQIAEAEENSQVDHLSWLREQWQLDQEAGMQYLTCVRGIYELNPSDKEVSSLILGCMPEASIRAMNQNYPESAIIINPAVAPMTTNE